MITFKPTLRCFSTSTEHAIGSYGFIDDDGVFFRMGPVPTRAVVIRSSPVPYTLSEPIDESIHIVDPMFQSCDTAILQEELSKTMFDDQVTWETHLKQECMLVITAIVYGETVYEKNGVKLSGALIGMAQVLEYPSTACCGNGSCCILN